MKTKVESSVFQVLVSFSAYGSSGSLDITPQSPLGPFERTRSRQKTVKEPVEREREGQCLFPFFFFFCHLFVLVCCSIVSPFSFLFLFLFLFLTDEWPFFFCNLSASQTLRELKDTPLVMMWYGTFSLMPFYCLLSFFFRCCVHIYINIYIYIYICLPHTSSCFSFLL